MEDRIKYAPWLKALSAADKVQARRFAAARALELGWGGISTVERLTGMSHTTIRKGIRELQSGEKLEPPERLRKPGGGVRRLKSKIQNLLTTLRGLWMRIQQATQ